MASPKNILTDLDLNQNELKQPVIHKLAAAPGTPVEGQSYYDTTLKVERFYDGTTWKNKFTAGGGNGSGAEIDLGNRIDGGEIVDLGLRL